MPPSSARRKLFRSPLRELAYTHCELDLPACGPELPNAIERALRAAPDDRRWAHAGERADSVDDKPFAAE